MALIIIMIMKGWHTLIECSDTLIEQLYCISLIVYIQPASGINSMTFYFSETCIIQVYLIKNKIYFGRIMGENLGKFFKEK